MHGPGVLEALKVQQTQNLTKPDIVRKATGGSRQEVIRYAQPSLALRTQTLRDSTTCEEYRGIFTVPPSLSIGSLCQLGKPCHAQEGGRDLEKPIQCTRWKRSRRFVGIHLAGQPLTDGTFCAGVPSRTCRAEHEAGDAALGLAEHGVVYATRVFVVPVM